MTRIVVANAVMGVLLWWLAGDAARWASMPFVDARAHAVVARSCWAPLVYFAVLFVAGMRCRHLRSASS